MQYCIDFSLDWRILPCDTRRATMGMLWERLNRLLIHLSMIRNILKIAFRNLKKNKIFPADHFGLAVGCCVSVIVHYVRYERSYESFHKMQINLSASRLISTMALNL